MGQKVHPIGMRLGITKRHSAIWYAEKSKYTSNLLADIKLRGELMARFERASVSEIRIERMANNAQVIIRTASPGIVIGKKGAEIDALNKIASRCLGMDVYIDIQEIHKPELASRLVAEGIARQLEKRVMFRRAMKRAVSSTMEAGALGIKVAVSGRLAGADIARSESYKEGRVPLHTLRADIDYAMIEAKTTYGILGVKVWIFRSEIMDFAKSYAEDEDAAQKRGLRRSGKKKLKRGPGRRWH